MENQNLSQWVYDTAGVTSIILFLAVVLTLLIYLMYYWNQQDKQTKEFISLLDEKEKALILNYQQAKKVIFKKRSKKQ